MSDDLALVKRAVAAAKEWKVAAVARGHDAIPWIVSVWRDGVLLGVLVIDEDHEDKLVEVAALTGADMLVYAADSWTATVEPDGPALEGMSPAERFAAGDKDVTEALVVSAHRPDRPPLTASLDYVRVGRRIEWIDGPELVSGVIGGVPDLIAEGWRRARETPLVPMPFALAAEALGVTAATMHITPPPRNEPCPCGSGAKAKRCCWGAS